MSETSQTVSSNLPNINTSYNFGNFDPSNLDVEETVNVVVLIDTSVSMADKESILNDEIRFLIEACQHMHQAPKIMVSTGRFDSSIEVLTGFQPVSNITPPHFTPNGGATKLYEACHEFLKNAVAQHQRALDAGLSNKTIFFVLTDGADNASASGSAKAVKDLITYMMTDESAVGTFISILCGIGNPSIFENAQKEMGIQKLHVIDNTADEKTNRRELKKVIGILSQSISSASTKPGPLVF